MNVTQDLIIRRVVSRYVKRYFDRTAKTYKYGQKDDFPQVALELVGNNGTAMRAIRKVSEYVRAYGFQDDAFGNSVIGKKGETANQILGQLSFQVAMWEALDIYAYRNGLGKVAAIDVVPFETTRKRQDGNFYVNPTMGTDQYNKRKAVLHPFFKGSQIDAATLKAHLKGFGDPGEILYLFDADSFSRDYPIPDWFAGEFDVKSGGEFQQFDLENIMNGFLASAIATFFGNIDDKKKDEAGKTDWDYYTDQLKNLTGNAEKDANGLSGRGKIAAFNFKSKEEAPEIQQLSTEKVVTATIPKRDQINREVSMLWGVHPVLLGHGEASVLGNQQAMANASAELARSVQPYQDLISRAMTMLYGPADHGYAITSYKPYNYIPDSMLKDLTPDERRGLIGYDELPFQYTPEQQANIVKIMKLPDAIKDRLIQSLSTEQLIQLSGVNFITTQPTQDGQTDQ